MFDVTIGMARGRLVGLRVGGLFGFNLLAGRYFRHFSKIKVCRNQAKSEEQKRSPKKNSSPGPFSNWCLGERESFTAFSTLLGGSPL